MTTSKYQPGQVINGFTIVAHAGRKEYPQPDGSKRSVRQWKVRCHCGREWVTQLSGIVSGAVKSCGCAHPHNVDLTGQRFNNWTVIGRTTRTTKDGMAWVVQCTCGRKSKATTHALRHGTSKRCIVCANVRPDDAFVRLVDRAVTMLRELPIPDSVADKRRQLLDELTPHFDKLRQRLPDLEN